MDKLDPMQNQLCRVCDEPAAGFHFGAFTCEGCKSFFGRTSNNQSVIQECKNNYRCIINKKNRTACKACRLRKCLMVGMSKSGSRYGRRSNWFKIHCLMQQAASHRQSVGGGLSHPFDSPSQGSVSGSIQTSLLSRPPIQTSSPSLDTRKMETKLTKPRTTLWRPLEPSAEDERKSPIRKSPGLGDDSKYHLQPPPMHSTNSQNLLPASFQHKPPIIPDLSQLFRLQNSYNFAHLSSPESNQDKEENDDIAQFSPLTMAAAAAAAAHAANAANAASSSSRFSALFGSHPLGFLPPTFNIPALSALPLHKQMLLSPLLASSHLWASARTVYPFLAPSTTPPPTTTSAVGPIDVEKTLAEHKALLERFRTTFSSQHIASASSNVINVDIAATSDDESTSSLTGGGTMPHLSDTEDEDVEEDNRSKRKEDAALDLTCV